MGRGYLTFGPISTIRRYASVHLFAAMVASTWSRQRSTTGPLALLLKLRLFAQPQCRAMIRSSTALRGTWLPSQLSGLGVRRSFATKSCCPHRPLWLASSWCSCLEVPRPASKRDIGYQLRRRSRLFIILFKGDGISEPPEHSPPVT